MALWLPNTSHVKKSIFSPYFPVIWNATFYHNEDDTAVMAESEEELKSLLMKVKEEDEKADLKFNIKKAKIMASDPITS